MHTHPNSFGSIILNIWWEVEPLEPARLPFPTFTTTPCHICLSGKWMPFIFSVPLHALLLEAYETSEDVKVGTALLESLLCRFSLAIAEVERREAPIKDGMSASKGTDTQPFTVDEGPGLLVAPSISLAGLKRDHCMTLKHAIRFARRTQVSIFSYFRDCLLRDNTLLGRASCLIARMKSLRLQLTWSFSWARILALHSRFSNWE